MLRGCGHPDRRVGPVADRRSEAVPERVTLRLGLGADLGRGHRWGRCHGRVVTAVQQRPLAPGERQGPMTPTIMLRAGLGWKPPAAIRAASSWACWGVGRCVP